MKVQGGNRGGYCSNVDYLTSILLIEETSYYLNVMYFVKLKRIHFSLFRRNKKVISKGIFLVI